MSITLPISAGSLFLLLFIIMGTFFLLGAFVVPIMIIFTIVCYAGAFIFANIEYGWIQLK